jgi:hypothetical protein
MLNSSQMIDIRTGDRDWDAAFALSQTGAFRLFFPPNEHLPNPSIVSVRGPDNGYSPKGDGTDYPASWNGQTPYEAYYLASVLPVSSAAQDLFGNFLAVQNEEGMIDGRPSLSGQKGRFLAAPILASLAWKFYEKTQDEKYLSQIFPPLLKFFWSWFSPDCDEDRDGLPQWRHILQTGFDENPLFDAWHDWSLGVDITQLHSPELESMLYQEAATLIKMAELLERNDALTLLHEQAARLRTSIDAMWQPRTGLYHYRDRETGTSLAGRVLARQQGPGVITTKMKFDGPVRLLVEVQSQNPMVKRPEIRIHQFSTKPADEIVSNSAYQRRNNGLIYTTQKTYARLAKVQVKGLEEGDTVVVSTLDFTSEDHTLLMPLWAGIPDEQHAQVMIGRALLDASRFHRPYGIPACPVAPSGHPEAEAVFTAVHLPWNLFICEGLLRYGFRSDAARIMAHFMTAIVQNLKQNRAFFARYHAETGIGIGERNVLTGFAPVGLFLQILGVQIHSSTRVRLEGENPFPWEVTICYRGLKVVRGLNKTVVTFGNGKSATVTDIAPCVVEL